MSGRYRLHLPRRLYDELLAQAVAELPNECCGLLAGQVDERGRAWVTRRYPLVNEAASPVEFVSEPRSLFEAMRDMRREGTDVLAVYHSHPRSPPRPSRTDRERNYSPDVMNLIVSLLIRPPTAACWWLTADGQAEAEWEVSDEP